MKKSIIYSIFFVLAWLNTLALQAQSVINSDTSKIYKQQHLNDVVVKGNRPMMKVGDKSNLIYDAEQLAKNRPIANAFDLLEEVSGVVVENERVSVLGSSSTTVIINGRKQNMSQAEIANLLTTMSPSQVKTIEVYHAAPPRFGVKGSAVNIILQKKRNSKLSTSGSAWTSLYQGAKYYQTGGLDLSFFQKKWMLDLDASLGFKKSNKDATLFSEHSVGELMHSMKNKDKRYSSSTADKVVTRFNYDFSKDENLNFYYLYRWDKPDFSLISPLWEDDVLKSNSVSDYKNKKHTHIFQLDYSHGNWSIGGDYVAFREDIKQDMIVSYQNENELKSVAKQNAYSGEVYADVSNEIGKGELRYGVNLSWANSKNTNINQWVNEIEHGNDDNHFLQREQCYEVYAGWSQKIGKLNLSANLLLNYFKAKYKDGNHWTTLWNKLSFLPSFTLNYKLKQHQRLLLSLSTNRIYPSYSMTSGWKAYTSDYIYIGGNPNIKPYDSFDMHLNYILNNRYIMGMYVTVMPKRYFQVLYQKHDKLEAGYEYFNTNKDNRVGMMAVVPHNWFSRLVSKFTAYAYLDHYEGTVYDLSFDKKFVAGQFILTNNAVIDKKKTFSLQLTARYTTKTIVGYAKDAAIFNTSFALTWNPYKTTWHLILKTTDLFGTYRRKRFVDYEGQHFNLEQNMDLRMINLTIRYSFNGYKQKKQQEVDTSRMGL